MPGYLHPVAVRLDAWVLDHREACKRRHALDAEYQEGSQAPCNLNEPGSHVTVSLPAALLVLDRSTL
jgi:hypothetical protein